MEIEVGKIRSLQQLTDNGKFKILAIDHRDVFVNMMKKNNLSIDKAKVVDEKLNIINLTKDMVSGYLIDPHFALPRVVIEDIIPKKTGYMVNIEDNDYDVKTFDENYLIKEFTVEKIKKIGASAVKLFLYYNPNSKCVDVQEKLIKEVADSCAKNEILFLVEPVLYSLDDSKKISKEERVLLTKMTINRLKRYNVDIFKIDFPGDLRGYTDEENIAICKEITSLQDKPWVIMSSGISIDDFAKQLKLALIGGASGYVVGRALWKEYVLKGENATKEDEQLVKDRIKLLNKIVDENYVDHIKAKVMIDQENWYKVIE